ncbi:hypothetical protein [Actinocorallia longicatena]|uniref:Uncharacterized protein n=1 Tax=Actinocorallia longicatena TaxID=111803 RepID=A0ABP6QF52_9ACTN
MTKLEASIVLAVARIHAIPHAEAAAWVSDVLDKGTSSPHFEAVQPAFFEVVMPVWTQLKGLFAAVAPFLSEADAPPSSLDLKSCPDGEPHAQHEWDDFHGAAWLCGAVGR